jgi:hypothetical protein
MQINFPAGHGVLKRNPLAKNPGEPALLGMIHLALGTASGSPSVPLQVSAWIHATDRSHFFYALKFHDAEGEITGELQPTFKFLDEDPDYKGCIKANGDMLVRGYRVDVDGDTEIHLEIRETMAPVDGSTSSSQTD